MGRKPESSSEQKGTDNLTVSLDASEIINWSDREDAAGKLPELLFRLVVGTLPEPAFRINMPSGSSVRLPGWDGVLKVGRGNEWVPDGVSGWEMSCDKNVTSKANSDYEKRTGDPLDLDLSMTTFVFVTPRGWRHKRRWEKRRRLEGKWRDVRAYDGHDLAQWLRQSEDVTRWLVGVIYRSPFDFEAIGKVMDFQEETLNRLTAGFAAMGVDPAALLTPVRNQAEPPDSEPMQDPAQRKLSERIDAARDLMQQGLIVAGRTQLERIEYDEEELSDSLRFRLLTNLAVCALGEDKFDEASCLLEEAHRIQPENRTGISNAALAAQLQQNPERAAELAQKALTICPRDSNAAATLIGALWEIGDSQRLEEFVSSAEWITRESSSASAVARVRVQQMRHDEAIALYRSLIDLGPDDANAHIGLSQCLLMHAQGERLPVAYSSEALARINEAEIEADRAIDLLQPTQLSARRHEALVLRAGARVLLGKVDEAMGDVDAVLGEMPQHPVAALNKGLILLKKGNPGEARKWLESIQDADVRGDSLLPLADACIESGDANAAISLLKGSFNLHHPEREDIARAESLMRAEAAVGSEDSVGPVLDASMLRHRNDPALIVLDAVRQSLHGDTESTAKALIKAIELTREPHRQALQTQLGRLYASVGRFPDAIEQFRNACGSDISHPATVPLLLSLFNSGQYREALDLARKIRDKGEPLPRVVVEVEANVLGYVGDARAAALRHSELCSRRDSTADDSVRLAMAQFRCGERDAALKTILAIDVSALGHDSQALIELAHIKRFLGATNYLHDAYLARRYGLNNPDAHLGYFILFSGREEEWEEPVVVGPGCSVCIKSDNEEQWWHILEAAEEPYGSKELSLEDDFAQRLAGRNVGDVVVLGEGIGKLSYEITDIQSKYVRAYQEIAEEFPIRFPGNKSLLRVKMDSNFTEFFQSIDLRYQYVSNAETMYKSKQLPFPAFCSLVGRSTLETWPSYIAQPTALLYFGTGTNEETDEARELLGAADAIVLDTIALLTVHKLEIAEQLRTRFSRVTIPQHVFDEIQMNVCVIRMERAPSSHVGKDDTGRYTQTEIPDSFWKEREAYFLSVLELAESFERIPSYPMLSADNREETIDMLTLSGASAVYAGEEQCQVKPILISDDLIQSSFARSLGIGSANTQALLVELSRSGAISAEEYSSNVEQLALMNYWFVRVTAEDILRSLEAYRFQTTQGTLAMLRTLRGPDCTEDAAASVAAELVASLAKGPLLPEHLDILLQLVLEEIRSGRPTNQVLWKFRREIVRRLQLLPLQSSRVLQVVDLYLAR